MYKIFYFLFVVFSLLIMINDNDMGFFFILVSFFSFLMLIKNGMCGFLVNYVLNIREVYFYV